jgi:hypothetical protein
MHAPPKTRVQKILLSYLTKTLMSLLLISANAPLRRNKRVPKTLLSFLANMLLRRKKSVPKILLSFLTNMLLSLLISKNAPLRTIP